MMMKKIWILGLLPVLVACGNNSNSEPTQFAFENEQSSTPSTIVNEDGEAVMEVLPETGKAAEAKIGNAELNPEHGMPGHRCDIPVGAPLNSAPVAAPNMPADIQPMPADIQPMPAPSVAPQATPAGFSGKPNPEHGMPGHRCDMPVGATLP